MSVSFCLNSSQQLQLIRVVMAGLLWLLPYTTTTAQKHAASILDYIEQVKGSQVARGECWDLVAGALNHAGAEWYPPLGFGKEVSYPQQKIKPGDVVSFKKVRIISPNNTWYMFEEHFALVYKVIDKNAFVIAHQNYDGIRTVGFLTIDMRHQSKGKIRFYRPA